LLLWQVRKQILPAVLRLISGANSPERLAALIDFAFKLWSGG
jgi:lysozyme